MGSLWEETCEIPGFDRLEGDLSTGVLVIGGGHGRGALRPPATARGSALRAGGGGNALQRHHKEHDGKNNLPARLYL